MTAKKKSSSRKAGKSSAPKNALKVFVTIIVSIIAGIVITNLLLQKPPQPQTVKPQISKPKVVQPKKIATKYSPSESIKPSAKKKAPPPAITPRELPAPKMKTEAPQLPRIVFVIDDIGNSSDWEKELDALDDDVTYAILPQLPYSRHFAEMGRRNGAEIIVHLPLEADDGRFPGPGVITTRMSKTAVLKVLERDLSTVPYHVGINNHMGSKGTSNERLMTVILESLKQRNLFFLDSFTTHDSVVVEVGSQVRLPVLRRDVFLDNVDEKPAILKQIDELKEKARENGSAIGIGHYRKNTLEILRQEIPRMRKEGFAVTSLRDLLD
jgi:polysaccharide deacetylase 2 family uncharacterized protein YibQ